VAEINPMRALNRYDDGIDAFSFEYKDERQRFHFLAQFVYSTPAVVEDGGQKRLAYDVLISRIGKTDCGSGTAMRPVADVEAVKNNIAEYFKSHGLDTAKTPPARTIFE
jgi:hypothetical protein